MASAAARSSSPSVWTDPAWKDSGLTLRAPMTAAGTPRPRGTPARMARWAIEPRAATPARRLPGGDGCAGCGRSPHRRGSPLEQGARQRVQLLDVPLEDLLGAARGFQDDPLDLRVHDEGRVLAVALL